MLEFNKTICYTEVSLKEMYKAVGDETMTNVGFLVTFFIIIFLVVVFALIAVIGAVSGAVAGYVDEAEADEDV